MGAILRGFKACIFAKTKEEVEDIIEEWKEEFDWNNGIPWQVGVNATETEVQEAIEKTENFVQSCNRLEKILEGGKRELI